MVLGLQVKLGGIADGEVRAGVLASICSNCLHDASATECLSD